jgi:phospholipase A1/A2
MTKPLVSFAVFILTVLLGGGSAPEATLSSYQSCLLEYLESSEADVPVGVLKEQCLNATKPDEDAALSAQHTEPLKEPVPPEESLVENRIDAERATRANPFVLSPHKQNYVLLASYNDTPNYEAYNMPESDYDRVEMKFQLSFKIPVFEGLFGSRTDLYAAYTNLSFWQAYNRDISSPFRETVHEPELFLVIPNVLPEAWQWQGWRNELMQFGVVHQSNGQGGYRSRSWNRLYANLLFEKDNYILGFKPWYRIPEDNDDNPDIEDYLGHYELYGFYKHQNQTFSLMLRNLFDAENRDTAQLDWSFPLYRHWRGYMQYFYGYGESLIDYNAKSHRIGFGLQLTDWL